MKPQIKIISDGTGATTKVVTDGGVDISHAIERIDLTITATGRNEATVYALLVGAEVDATIIDLQTQILPPPAPKTIYKLVIGEPMDVIRPSDIGTGAEPYSQSGFRLERHDPLPSWGENVNVLATGFLAPIGPLELVMEEAE